MRPRFYLVINGILIWPSGLNWTDDLCMKIETETEDDKAYAYRYFSEPLTTYLRQEARANECVSILKRYWGKCDLVLVTHSNGADIACRILDRFDGPISHVHMFAPACLADMNANGLNNAMLSGRLQNLTVYRSTKDSTLKSLYWMSKQPAIGWVPAMFGFDYKTMGYQGPANAAVGEPRLRVIQKDMHHTEWYADIPRLFNWVTVKT
jgi:alpha-beta hydrolase superfamily lysophospholipase